MSNRLSAEMRRLYGLADQPLTPGSGSLPLVDGAGRVRAMVLALKGPADWSALSPVWRGVQTDLDLPAPAIAVDGVDAYALWFSLAEPVPLADALSFLNGLRERFLAGVKPQRLILRPGEAASAQTTPFIPAEQGDSGNWSAFVAPDLAAVFGDEPLLDVPPGFDAQADLLSRLACIKTAEFESALAQLQPTANSAAAAAAPSHVSDPLRFASAERYEDPRQFLRDVMNDRSVSLALRIEAAKALIP